MGGCTFITSGEGKSAQEVFDKLKKQAQYDYGHSGYTGTIAEKDSFTMIDFPVNTLANEKERKPIVLYFINKMIDEGDPRIDDKWGPAGCIEWWPNCYVFFGWASE